MEHLLIIDASPLIYSTFNSVGHLSSSAGEPTGLRYGFVRAVRSYQEKTRAGKVVIAFDSPGPVHKAEGLNHYKANRVWTDAKAEMYGQVPALRKMLDLTCWTQVDAEGYEADDLIGAITRAKATRGHLVTIASPDNDLLQLLRDNVRVFRAGSAKKRTKDRLLQDADVFGTYGVHPEYLCLYRAICGDVSDNLPGILTRGDAKQELQHLLHQQGRRTQPFTPDDLAELTWKILPNSPLSVLTTPANAELLRAHYQVMSLPTPPSIKVRKGQKDPAKLTELFRQLEFQSMMKYIDQLTGTNTACLLETSPT
jgi:DNA polymerase-1